MKQTISENDRYKLEIDIAKNRLYFTPLREWESPADVPNYLDDVRKCATKLKRGFSALSDTSLTTVFSPEVNALLMESIEIMKGLGQWKTAVFNKSIVLDIYLDKIYKKADREHVELRTFNDLEEAEKWLDA